MTQKNIFLKITLVTIGSFIVFIAVLFGLDPEKFGILAFIPFYTSFFIFLWGLFFLLRFYSNILLKNNNKNNFYNFTVQSGLLAFLSVGLLLLEHIGRFNTLNIIILFIAMILLEFIFSKK